MKSACLKSRVIVASLIVAALSVAQTTSLKQKSYVAGRFAFVLDGSKNAGFLHSVEGGGVRAEEIKVEMGMSMGQPIKDWIDAALRTGARRSFSIIYAGSDYKVRAYRDFHDALIRFCYEFESIALDRAQHLRRGVALAAGDQCHRKGCEYQPRHQRSFHETISVGGVTPARNRRVVC